jgi:putative ABC transport system ATP-binding protein
MLIQCIQLTKSYFIGRVEVKALQGIDLEIEKGSFTAILGPSGSGKSTLMNIIGCLDTPTNGRYILDSIDVSQTKKNRLPYIRNKMIGFIFQSFNLLPRYNVFHNVELPLIYSGLSARERQRRVMEVVELVGLDSRLKHKPNELSGGQKQRVAIARALVNKPSLILADEPTGNLDTATGAEIIKVFLDLIAHGESIVMVTHDLHMAKIAERRIKIVDGKRVKADDDEDEELDHQGQSAGKKSYL